MSKRKYNKKSPYWDKFNKPLDQMSASLHDSDAKNIEPISAGESFYVAAASEGGYSRGGSGTSTSRRRNSASSGTKSNRFANIRQGMLPYQVSADGVNVRDSIELCQKAYANVPVFRNSIDIMAELANSPIYVEQGNEASRNFIKKWFTKINFWNLKDQYFREYYRSGNVFFYRIDGKFNAEDFAKLNKIYGSKYLEDGKIPLRYILLNPFDITASRSTSYNKNVYKKILSEYELERLQNPKNEEDEEIFKSLPKETRDRIKQGGWGKNGINMNLDASKLSHSFYKKQDYEPFAIPFGFPVLDDINWKMELKKVDQAVSRTIENVILLITMGTDPEKGGINPNNLAAMQSLFQNESVGRVLVADYTTKAEFILPDIGKIIGPDKYQIVNEDIRQGLQNVIVGDEKYKNTQVKAEIFLERLKEARQSFIHNFLQPQIKMVCKQMGFKTYPTAKFEEIDIKDELALQRVVTRLLEVGILTPEQGINAIKTGIYPNPEDIGPAQKEYIEQRKDGMYNPLVGGVPLVNQDDDGAIDGTPPQSPQGGKKIGQKKAGRPYGTRGIPKQSTASELYSRKEIQSMVYKIEELQTHLEVKMLASVKKKELTDNQKSLMSDLCRSLVLGKDAKSWKRFGTACIKDFEKISEISIIPEIVEISESHQLETYPSALLYHSKKTSK
jgi:hypothetical protein|tara:strand:- start:2197 stop:4215 length:2019 start_codon:yes stop_codon:yes gene_type:complete